MPDVTIPVGRIESLIREFEQRAVQVGPQEARVYKSVCADLRRAIEPEATP